MLVQTQWQKSTIVVAPSRTQLLKYTVQGCVKILFGGRGLQQFMFVCFVTEAKSSGQAGGKGARSFPYEWVSNMKQICMVGCSCVPFISYPERTEPVVWNTIQMDTSIYISHKRKDFKGFIGILIKSWLTLPIFFCKFSRKAFLGSTRN